MPLDLRDAASLLQSAEAYFRSIDRYSVMLTVRGSDKPDIVHYFFKQPGYVRVEAIAPLSGAVLVYSPLTERVTLWPRGFRSFPSFTLSCDNKLIQSRTGQRIDRSDLGTLYRNVGMLLARGRGVLAGDSREGKEVVRMTVEVEELSPLGDIHGFELLFDTENGVPIDVVSRGKQGRLIEEVEIRDWRLDPALPQDFFQP